MNLLYIGQYSLGSTSKMRADEIQNILKPGRFDIIDTDVPFNETGKYMRSLGFRLKIGTLIVNMSRYIRNSLTNVYYDLIWIDKGIFLDRETIRILRAITPRLVHFTPDMAFYSNRSRLFEKSLPYYDFVITTKSIEKSRYLEFIDEDKMLITTQGFSKRYHKPHVDFSDKENSVAFVGLAELARFNFVEALLNADVKVKVAGYGWERFIKRHGQNPLFTHVSEKLINHEYAQFISSSYFAWGALSKRFDEYHTTRTFEIPACGTALLTETNSETVSFFTNDEAIFYNSVEDLIERIAYYVNNKKELEELTIRGQECVSTSGFDYESLLRGCLKEILR